MLVLGKRNVNEISKVDINNQIYNSIPSGHEWKVSLAKEILQIKNDNLETENLNATELDEILHHIDWRLTFFFVTCIKPSCLK